MQGLDKCIAPMGMTRSSCRPRQFLSRSHRAVHGEMTLFLYDAQDLDAQGLWLQGMNGVKSGYCRIEEKDKSRPSSGELAIK